MRLKDYYKTLEVPAAATPEEIKKSFRRLAMAYHPDTNTENPYAAAHFREIKEAYNILIDPEQRRAYDEERWLSGMSTRAKDAIRVTPDWILHESRRLRRHMEIVDTYRMSHQALYDYILLLLSDEHMDVLHRAADRERNHAILRELLASTRRLKAAWLRPLSERMAPLAVPDEALSGELRKALRERETQEKWDRNFPLIVVAIALVLCLVWLLLMRFG